MIGSGTFEAECAVDATTVVLECRGWLLIGHECHDRLFVQCKIISPLFCFVCCCNFSESGCNIYMLFFGRRNQGIPGNHFRIQFLSIVKEDSFTIVECRNNC